jgi:hypothetical protein
MSGETTTEKNPLRAVCDAFLVVRTEHDRICTFDVFLDLRVHHLEVRVEHRLVRLPHRAQRLVDPHEALSEQSGAIVYRIQRIPELVAGDIDELFLQLPTPLGLLRVGSFDLDDLALELAKTRNVVPNANPAQEVPVRTRREFGLDVVEYLLENSAIVNVNTQGACSLTSLHPSFAA